MCIRGLFKVISAACLASLLCGCFLIPKQVEFFQKKIKEVPQKTEKQVEFERQAADVIDKKVEQAYIAAIKEDSSTNVTKPLGHAHAVAPALSESLGPPKTPFTGNPTNLALNIEKGVATLNIKIDDYREDMAPLEGKKIEDTGAIKMPYFVALGIFLVLLWVGKMAYQIASAAGWFHPAVGIGMNAVKIPAKALAKVASEAIEGGEEFKKYIEAEFTDEETVNKIKKLFAQAHLTKQSRDTQQVIKDLTRK